MATITRDDEWVSYKGLVILIPTLFAALLAATLWVRLIIGGTSISLGAIIGAFEIGYLVMSAVSIDQTRQGLILLFGRSLKQVGPGLQFVPAFICTVITETLNEIQLELPGNPEELFLDDEKLFDPRGKHQGLFLPIRVTFTGVLPEETLKKAGIEKNALTNLTTQQVAPTIAFKIVDFPQFVREIGDRWKARQQLTDFANTILVEEFSDEMLIDVFKDVPKYTDNLKKRLVDLTTNWGIEIIYVKIKIVLSHSLNAALQKIAEETASAQANVVKAEGTKRIAELEGAGEGKRQQEIIDGVTRGLQKRMADLGIDGNLVIAQDVATKLSAGGNTIVLGPEGFSQLLGAAAFLKKEPAKPTTTT